MAHAFLLESGSWNLTGNWIEREGLVVPLKGKTIVSWGKDDWFAMVTKLILDNPDRTEVLWRYRGRMSDQSRRYTFVLEHSVVGKMEGEGIIGDQAIIQRYWALQDSQRRSGFETISRLDAKTYLLSSAAMSGPRLNNTAEAQLVRA